jgi:hypothetical protein
VLNCLLKQCCRSPLAFLLAWYKARTIKNEGRWILEVDPLNVVAKIPFVDGSDYKKKYADG